MIKTYFIGYVQNFNKDNKIIDYNVLDSIKKENPKTIVKKFIVAHEGESNSHVIGKGSSKFKWAKNVIHTITDKIKSGIQCIKGHTQDNIKRGEQVLGYIVGKGTELINNTLHSVVAVAFTNPSESDYDSISMEANIEYDSDYNVLAVNDLFRFALGKIKDGQVPAFENALSQGTIQCFSKQIQNLEQEQGKKIMTFSEVKQAIRELNIYPSQLWDVKELIGKPEKDEKGNIIFVGSVDDRIISYLSKSIPDNSGTFKELEELKKKNEEFVKQVQELQTYKKQILSKESQGKVLEILKERKVSEKLSKFVEKNLDKLQIDENNLDKSLSDFIETQSKEFQKIEEIFGEPKPTPQSGNQADHTGEPSAIDLSKISSF